MKIKYYPALVSSNKKNNRNFMSNDKIEYLVTLIKFKDEEQAKHFFDIQFVRLIKDIPELIEEKDE